MGAIQTMAVIAALSCLAVSPKELPGARLRNPKAPASEPAPSEPAASSDMEPCPAPSWQLSDYAVTSFVPWGGRLTRTVRYPGFYDPLGGYCYWPMRRTRYVAIGREPTGPEWSPLDYVTWAASQYTPVPVVTQPAVPVAAMRSETTPGTGSQPECKRETFGSRLAPMLGGKRLVILSFAVGEAKLKRGEFGEAVHAFSAALREAPEDAAAHLALALAFVGAGSYESAARMLREGLDELPGWDVVLLKPEEVFGDAERYGQVLGRLKGAFEADPSDADLRLLLGFLCFAGRDREGAGDLLKATQAEEGDPYLEKLRAAALGVWPEERPAEQAEAREK